MLRYSITDSFNLAHIAAGTHALSWGLTKVSAHTAAGAFPFPQVHNRQYKPKTCLFMVFAILTDFFMTLYESFNIFLYYNTMVREPWVGQKTT